MKTKYLVMEFELSDREGRYIQWNMEDIHFLATEYLPVVAGNHLSTIEIEKIYRQLRNLPLGEVQKIGGYNVVKIQTE